MKELNCHVNTTLPLNVMNVLHASTVVATDMLCSSSHNA